MSDRSDVGIGRKQMMLAHLRYELVAETLRGVEQEIGDLRGALPDTISTPGGLVRLENLRADASEGIGSALRAVDSLMKRVKEFCGAKREQ
jgi:hypothetical protein